MSRDHTPECAAAEPCSRLRTVTTAVVSGVSDIAQVAELAVLRHEIDRAALLDDHAGAVLGKPVREGVLQRRDGRGDRYTVTLTSAVRHRAVAC